MLGHVYFKRKTIPHPAVDEVH